MIDEGYELLLAPQCVYEFYVVATRPVEQNGLGCSPTEAMQLLQNVATIFPVLEDAQSTPQEWQTLCKNYGIQGKQAHDVRLVAWMVRQNVHELLTLNPKDFALFRGLITVQGV